MKVPNDPGAKRGSLVVAIGGSIIDSDLPSESTLLLFGRVRAELSRRLGVLSDCINTISSSSGWAGLGGGALAVKFLPKRLLNVSSKSVGVLSPVDGGLDDSFPSDRPGTEVGPSAGVIAPRRWISSRLPRPTPSGTAGLIEAVGCEVFAVASLLFECL